MAGTFNYNTSVVNCFRSLYLWVNLQLIKIYSANRTSCELLSFFVPLGEFTAQSLQDVVGQRVMNCDRKRKSWSFQTGISLFIKGLEILSEEFELLLYLGKRGGIFSDEQLHAAELFVGDV